MLNLVISFFLCIFRIMKKYVLFTIAIATIALASCGSGSTTQATKDSTAVKVPDSTKVDSVYAVK